MKHKYSFLAIIIVLSLAILACSLADIGGTPLPEGVLFQDDFADSSSGWGEYDDADGVTDYINGVYRIYVNDVNSYYWSNPGLNFTDTVIEVDATKAGGPDDNDFGVICRHQDIENFYFFIISSDGYYGVGKVIAGVEELIGSDQYLTSDAIKTGASTNKIRVDCVGSRLALYANGTKLAEYTDNAFSDGDVGLIAGTFDTAGTDIHFDNFVVREPE